MMVPDCGLVSHPLRTASLTARVKRSQSRAVVSNGTREEMEIDVAAMHSYGLWATLQKDD